MASQEQRQHPRSPAEGKIWVRWMSESGVPLGGRMPIKDRSNAGLGVLLERRVAPSTYVHVECHDLKIAGMAVVRHCTQQGMRWFAGLQVGSRSMRKD